MLDEVAMMLHCNEKMLNFTRHTISAILDNDSTNHDDPTTGRKAKFKPPFGKLSIVETSQWKKTHDDVQTEMDSSFKIERTGQYIIIKIQRWLIPGLDHKTHSYGCERYRNTLENGEYENMKDVRIITVEDFPP
jgi:hypothetical protein